MRRGVLALAMLILAGCGSSATSQHSEPVPAAAKMSSRAWVPSVPPRLCQLYGLFASNARAHGLFASNARAATKDDPNLLIGKLASDGTAMGDHPGRFAAIAAPIAGRLERSSASLVRSLERLPAAVSRSYTTGEFAVLLILERRVTHDLGEVAVTLRHAQRAATPAALTHVADAVQLYGRDSSAADDAARGLGLEDSVLAGRSPNCSARTG